MLLLAEGATGTSMTGFLSNIQTIVQAVITAAQAVFGFITSETVLPYFLIGIGLSICLFVINMIRRVVWGA